MHAHRRWKAAFDCCDPIRESCTGSSLITMVDHARARAQVTGYQQHVEWSNARQAWVVTVSIPMRQIKPSTSRFDSAVKPRKGDAQ